jgi:invasion protein IalB
MAQTKLQRAAAGPMGRTGIAGAALLLALAGFAGSALAQAKKEKAPPAAAPADAASQSAWVKLCEKANVVGKDKDGKEEKKELNICLTHHERLDGNTGMVLISAAVRQVEGVDKQQFMVMVPLGMMIQPGMRAAVYPKDLWEKVQKNEKIDDTKLKPIRLTYTLCHMGGCTAEMESTPELLADLKSGGGIMVLAINAGGQPVAFPVPLNGFDATFAGPPIDNAKYSEARRQLMQQIALRQQAQQEELKKQNDDLQKMQGNEALKGAAAPKAPAAKKEKQEK